MFIENMRHAKNKTRVLVILLIIAVAAGIVIMFSNFGSGNIASGSSSSSSSYLDDAEDTAKSAASAAKADDTDMDAQGTAASSYLSLAIYQDLFLEDNTKSYEKALKYGQAMVTACASADEPDYETAYGYEFSAYQGLDDADGLSSAFNESLGDFDVTESYLDSYYSAMSTLGAYDQFTTDMATVTDLLNKKVDSGDDTTTTDSSGNEVTTSDLIAYVASLVTEASAAESSTDTTGTDTTDTTDTTSD